MGISEISSPELGVNLGLGGFSSSRIGGFSSPGVELRDFPAYIIEAVGGSQGAFIPKAVEGFDHRCINQQGRDHHIEAMQVIFIKFLGRMWQEERGYGGTHQ